MVFARDTCLLCETFTAEHLGPVLEGQINRHDETHPFVGGADHVEQQFGAQLTGRIVTQRVEDQQTNLGELPLATPKKPMSY